MLKRYPIIILPHPIIHSGFMISISRFPALASGLVLLGTLGASAQSAAPASLTVQVNKPGAAVNKNMYGLFFEDINFAPHRLEGPARGGQPRCLRRAQ
jgi:hypothetical protein